VVAGGIVVGFPLLTSFALTTAPASHGAVVIALLPAATAVTAVVRGKERPPRSDTRTRRMADGVLGSDGRRAADDRPDSHFGDPAAANRVTDRVGGVRLPGRGESTFLGFFAWYRGLAIGPMAQVSQVQLVQPVQTISWAALLLREQLTWATVRVRGRLAPVRG
jgi:hypothetical protein